MKDPHLTVGITCLAAVSNSRLLKNDTSGGRRPYAYKMSLVRATPDRAIQTILAQAMSAKSIGRELAIYRNSPERELFSWVEQDRPVAAAGLRRTGDTAELLHIATAADFRHQGFASRLVYELMSRFGLQALCAETDDDAVDFYRRTGFEVTQVPSPWPRARYRCVLRKTL